MAWDILDLECNGYRLDLLFNSCSLAFLTSIMKEIFMGEVFSFCTDVYQGLLLSNDVCQIYLLRIALLIP